VRGEKNARTMWILAFTDEEQRDGLYGDWLLWFAFGKLSVRPRAEASA